MYTQNLVTAEPRKMHTHQFVQNHQNAKLPKYTPTKMYTPRVLSQQSHAKCTPTSLCNPFLCFRSPPQTPLLILLLRFLLLRFLLIHQRLLLRVLLRLLLRLLLRVLLRLLSLHQRQ